MAARVARYPANGRAVTMSRGLSDSTWQEPLFQADVYDQDGHFVATVGNSFLMCVKGGAVRAPFATDAQILEAVLNDESVFS